MHHHNLLTATGSAARIASLATVVATATDWTSENTPRAAACSPAVLTYAAPTAASAAVNAAESA
ncbi:hypothetical protein, partial [Mycobacterium kansasii]|uniref:hypothetical protein n=1 Tax=Mycobacterium kansasii TaxID=1768 RepID=UPI001CA542B1